MDENNKKKSAGTLHMIAMIISLIGSAVMIISLFLPYISGGYGEITSVSMISYISLALGIGSVYAGGPELGIIMLVLVILIGLFALLAFILSFALKPAGIITFTILSAVFFTLMCWDFVSRGVLDSSRYWSIAFYLYILGAISCLFGAVFMKIQSKKIKQTEVQNG